MKSLQLSRVSIIVWIATLFLAANPSRAQVSLTVTPSVISNTYAGFITLNITGLNSNEQITVQRWLDANSNSVVDANEPLLEAFKMREGSAMVINGITNVSVPYDTNPATNAITTTLNFAPPQTLADITGQQIFRIVSTTGRFSPVSATFTVTNALLPQSVTGTVYSNGVVGLPNALVVALTMPNQNYAGAAVADSNGKYFLTLPVGQYGLIGLYPGYYIDQNLAGYALLTNGVSVTNNLSATNGTGPFVSGTVYDRASSNALGGVFLQLTVSGGSLFAVAFTDTNGNFSAPVTSNNWKIKFEGTQMAHRAYTVPENTATVVDATAGSVSNVDLGLWKANALYYGRFLDQHGAPLANYQLEADDSSNQFKANGFTDANGNYGVAILGTTNSPWYISPSGNNINLEQYIYNSAQNFISTNNVAEENDFFLLPVTAQISGRLTDNAGHPLQNIGISASSNIGTNNFNTDYVDTDTNGSYSFGASSGKWFVYVNASGGHSLASAGYYDPSNWHPVTIPPTNAVVNIVVYPANLPQFGQPSHPPGSQFQFNLYGASGQNYTIQVSTNLVSANWQTLTIISNLQNGPVFIQDFHATNGTRFYRAFEGP